jgi:hypothetical protein
VVIQKVEVKLFCSGTLEGICHAISGYYFVILQDH